MHTFEGKTTRFHFDGGLKDGDLIIHDKKTGNEVRIDANDILALVALEYVLPEKVSRLNNMSIHEILLKFE